MKTYTQPMAGALLAAERIYADLPTSVLELADVIATAYADAATNRAALHKIARPEDVAQHVATIMHGAVTERVFILALDGRSRVLDTLTVDGWANGVSVDPVSVLRWCLTVHGCTSCVMAHNHPSGDPTPSEADKVLTRRMVAAMKACGFELQDHVVVAASGFYSFLANGLI